MTSVGHPYPYTPIDVMFEVLRRAEGRLGFAGTLTSVGETYVIDDTEFQNSLFGDTDFQDNYIYRYRLPDNDRKKIITTNEPDTGRVNHGGSPYGNFGNGADLDYMYLTVDPDDFFNCLRNAQNRIHVAGMAPLSTLFDADMSWPTADYYNGALGGSGLTGAIASKTSDSDKVNSGAQSLVVTLTTAGGLCAGEVVYVQPGTRVFSAVNVANGSAGGAVTYKLWDVDNSAYIEPTHNVTYPGRRFGILPRLDTIPAGCYRIQPVISGINISDVFYWDCTFGPIQAGSRRLALGPRINQSYKLPHIYEAHYDSVPNLSPAVYDSATRRWGATYGQGLEYDVENFHTAAAPYHVDFRASAKLSWGHPMWMQFQALARDAEPISTVLTPLRANWDEYVAYVMWDIAKLGFSHQPGDPFWQSLLNEYQTYASIQTITDEDPKTQPEFEHVRHVL